MSIADRVAVMRNGELVQVGTPLELYRRPVSSWLADFVSTQPLNLFDAHVDGAGRIVLLEDTLVVEDAPDLSVDGGFTVGVRPEHVALRPDPAASTWHILTQEMLGSIVKYVVSDSRGREVTTMTTADEVLEPGTAVTLRVDPTRCMFFDSQSGLALTAAPTPGVSVVP